MRISRGGIPEQPVREREKPRRDGSPLWRYHQQLKRQGVTGDDYYELMVEKLGRSYPELAHLDPDEAARIALRHEGRVLTRDNRIIEADRIPLAVPDEGPPQMDPLPEWASIEEKAQRRAEHVEREMRYYDRLGQKYVTQEAIEDELDEAANDEAWRQMVDRADGYPTLDPYSGPVLNFFNEEDKF